MTRFLNALPVCCFIFILNNAFAGPDLEILRKKVINEVLQSSVSAQRINNLVATISEDGSWPDINYADVSRTGFQHGDHLKNIVSLCIAYRKQGSQFKSDKKVRKVINSSLDYWLKNDFICDNWWWNQIGTPNEFVKILLLMDNDLSKDQIIKALPIASRANLGAWGARPSGDRIKIAGISAKNALFQRNDSLFDSVIKVIEGEIKYASGPGLQYDLSFQHRTDKVISTLSYGMGYADAFAEWADFVAGTKYSFSDKALKLLIDYYLDGICQTMVYGKYPDPGAKNRGITRKGALDALGTATPERLLKATSYRKEDLEKIIKIRKEEIIPRLAGSSYFWASEYFSFQRPDYFTSVRMFSSRNHNMEMPYNGEGLMNHHYADGANFISRTGEEYSDIFPVFDWQMVPGTTVVRKPGLPSEDEIQKKGLTEFVGAVTDGIFGAAVFDFKSLHDPLEAKKAWFFFDKEYVCLGTGIASGADLPVTTAINQCLLNGEIVVMRGGRQSVVSQGEHEFKDIKWILHDSIGYFFPEPVDLKLMNQQSSPGSWFRINRQSDSPKESISLNVFKLWFDHGVKPKNAGYQYIVMPGVNSGNLNNAGSHIEILSNTREIQAVKNSKLNIVQAVFYRSGSIGIAPGITIELDSPGMILVVTDGKSVKSISVSDPSRRLSKMHLSLSVAGGVKNITIDLPQTVYAGQSKTIKLN